jgi:alcohol dehydrogenase YqhD (iron-dependent ADH family)
MRAFQYYMKTEVIFGAGRAEEAAQLARKHGGSRILVVYGGGSAIRSGLLDRICGALEREGLFYETFGGVRPNPWLSHARDGVQKAIAMKADLILAVGGGSVIDTAKAIAHGAADPDTDIWEFWSKKKTVTRSMPVGVVLTIPAAGSETSDSAVLTDTTQPLKCGLTTDFNRPAFAVLDPVLCTTLPAYQIGCGVTDILMHTLDRYFNPISDNEISDALAEALLRVVLENGRKVLADPEDLQAMSEIVWCGSLSHNGVTGLGGAKDFSPHQLGQAIGGVYDTAHGATLSAIWASWARYVADVDGYARFARFARNVWDIHEPDDKAAALAGIRAQEAYFAELGMPISLEELGHGILNEEALERLTERCSYGYSRTIGTFRVLDADAMRVIYINANVKEEQL